MTTALVTNTKLSSSLKSALQKPASFSHHTNQNRLADVRDDLELRFAGKKKKRFAAAAIFLASVASSLGFSSTSASAAPKQDIPSAYCRAVASIDADCDGVINYYDVLPGRADNGDDDKDWVLNKMDKYAGFDDKQFDSDRDRVPDYLDPFYGNNLGDEDRDGLPNLIDKFPYLPYNMTVADLLLTRNSHKTIAQILAESPAYAPATPTGGTGNSGNTGTSYYPSTGSGSYFPSTGSSSTTAADQRRAEQQRLEQQRLEQQAYQRKLEQQRLEQQRIERQRLEQQRIERQRQNDPWKNDYDHDHEVDRFDPHPTNPYLDSRNDPYDPRNWDN